MPATETATPQRMEFKTELKQLLDLITHSLYTKKEIFLRELISNAADAIDKLRFESLKAPDLLDGQSDFRIKLIADKEAGTLTIRDNGIGMTRESIVENLGTIARSGTKSFIENLKQAEVQDRPELIGQFGVGFYASFMVADRVTVVSRAAGIGAEAVRWESDGQGDFSVEPGEREGRGTDVTLHLRDDAKDFLDAWRLREIVKQYSDFIAHPIVLDEEQEIDGKKETKEQTLNSGQAIWLRPKSEVKEEEYNAFYKQVARDYDDPLKTIHVAAEGGAVEFRALMFLPAHRGMDWMTGPEKKSGLDLYVRRVLIQHECEQLVPEYLRFVKGVVDSADLPLNVSRETLQHNKVLERIKSNVTNRILRTLEEMRDKESETYLKFYQEFGSYLKEGVAREWSDRERLADLLLFESTRTEVGKYSSLAKYVEKMGVEQKEIYFLTGESRELLEHSPYLEAFRADGQEVLLLTDPVDEYFTGSFREYKGKTLKAIDRGKIDATEPDKAQAEQFKGLLDWAKSKLDAEVKEVRLSTRLKESAAVLVADEGAMGAHLERLLQRAGRGQEVPSAKRILELNPAHDVVKAMQEVWAKKPDDPRLEDYARLLYDQAVIAEGSRVKDPAAFARRINALLAKDATATTN